MVLTIAALDTAAKADNWILGEQISDSVSQRNLQPASHRFWAYVSAFGLGLMVMGTVMVMVMVPKALSQVG
jgi:hypothetical protein